MTSTRGQPPTQGSTQVSKESQKEAPNEQDTFLAIIDAIDSMEPERERHVSIQIDSSLRDAVRAVQSSGQAASVTISLKVKPGPDRRIGFHASVKAQLPRPPVAGVQLYADAEGCVHRSDPAQQRLPFVNAIAGRKEA